MQVFSCSAVFNLYFLFNDLKLTSQIHNKMENIFSMLLYIFLRISQAFFLNSSTDLSMAGFFL